MKLMIILRNTIKNNKEFWASGIHPSPSAPSLDIRKRYVKFQTHRQIGDFLIQYSIILFAVRIIGIKFVD